MQYSETTPEYSRIAGEDIADGKRDALTTIIKLMEVFDADIDMRDLKTFEEVFVLTYIRKLALMQQKQRAYGVGNILKAGERGIVVRMQDKVERMKTLLGDPDEQLNKVRALVEDADNVENTDDLVGIINQIGAAVKLNTNDEPLEDTYIDGGNYGDILYVVHEGGWGKPLAENVE